MINLVLWRSSRRLAWLDCHQKYHSDLSFCLRKGAHSRPWKDWFQNDGQSCIITFIGTNILTCTPFNPSSLGPLFWKEDLGFFSSSSLSSSSSSSPQVFCRRGVWRQRTGNWGHFQETHLHIDVAWWLDGLLIYDPIFTFHSIRDILIVTVTRRHTPTDTPYRFMIAHWLHTSFPSKCFFFQLIWWATASTMFTTIYWKSPSPGEVTSSLSVVVNGSLFKSWHTWLSPSQPLAASGFHHIWTHLQLPGRLPTIFGGLVKFVPWCDSHTQSVKFVKKKIARENSNQRIRKTELLHGWNIGLLTSPTYLITTLKSCSPNFGLGGFSNSKPGLFFPGEWAQVWVFQCVFPKRKTKGCGRCLGYPGNPAEAIKISQMLVARVKTCPGCDQVAPGNLDLHFSCLKPWNGDVTKNIVAIMPWFDAQPTHLNWFRNSNSRFTQHASHRKPWHGCPRVAHHFMTYSRLSWRR